MSDTKRIEWMITGYRQGDAGAYMSNALPKPVAWAVYRNGILHMLVGEGMEPSHCKREPLFTADQVLKLMTDERRHIISAWPTTDDYPSDIFRSTYCKEKP